MECADLRLSPDDLSREVVDSLLGREELIVLLLSLDGRSDEAAGGWRSSRGKGGSPPPHAGVEHQWDPALFNPRAHTPASP